MTARKEVDGEKPFEKGLKHPVREKNETQFSFRKLVPRRRECLRKFLVLENRTPAEGQLPRQIMHCPGKSGPEGTPFCP